MSTETRPNNGMQRTRIHRASHHQRSVRAADAERYAASLPCSGSFTGF
ncbi:MAG: hypothetical protein ACR2LM_06045 [Pyrinomonadaceae bacterium]